MKRILLLTTLFCFYLWNLKAQVANYTFAQSMGSYSSITGGTLHGTAIDDANYSFTLPFTFVYNGTNYTVARPTSNGFLVLGGNAPSTTQYTPLSSGSTNFAIAAIARDLNSTIRSEVLGTSPNRVYVCQWSSAYRYAVGSGENLNAQIRLYEGTNQIEITYGSFTTTNTTVTTGVLQVGLRGSATTDYNNRTTTTDWNATTAGVSNTATCAGTSAVKPASGLTFTWTPPAPPACAAPTGLTVSSITATGANLSWTAPGSAPSNGYEWEVRTSATPSGGTLAASGTTSAGVTTANATGLSANTTYYLHVRSDCGGDGFSSWASSTAFTTPVVEAVPYTQGFSTTSTPVGWTITGWTIGSTRGVTGNPGNNIYKNLWSSAPTGSFTTVALGPITAGMRLTMDYKHANYSSPYASPGAGSGSFLVEISTNYGSTYSTIATVANDASNAWRGLDYSLSAYVGQDIKVRISASRVSGDYDLAFDNIVVQVPPSCPAPTTLTATGITTSSANLGWTNNGSASAWDIEWGLTGFTQGTGTIINNTTTNPYLLSSLASNTTYQFYVRADCDPGNNNTTVSTWAGPFTFSTLFDCSMLTAITCDSEVTSGNLATTGGTINVASCGFSTPGKEARYTFTSTYAGNYVLQITNVNGGTGYIDYFYKVADGNCGTNTGWTCIDDNNAIGTDNFTLAANTTYYLLLDAESAASTANHTFKITCCPQATAATTTAITQNSATLQWTENGGATTWDIEWGPSGFTQGTGTFINDTGTKPYPLTSLSASTTYQWYVKPSCASTWLGPISFTTTLLNDQAAGAILLTQQTSCSPLTGQTSVGATQSLPAILCDGFTGNADDDVWYQFVATGTDAIINVTTTTDIVLEILASDATTSLLCSDALVAGGEEVNVTGFTPNDTYYIRVYSYASGGIPSFSICVHYPLCGANSVYLETTNGTYELDQPCDDGNGWTYYSDPNQAGNYMFAIQWDPNNTGANVTAKANAAVTINVQSMISASNGTISASYGMGRYWNVDLNGASMNDLVNVKFFYAPSEKTATETAAAAFATTNGVPNNGFSWFKTTGSTFTPADITATDFQAGVVLLTADGSGTENGVTYVQFNDISSFSGGTGATGAGAGFLPVELMAFRGNVMDAGNKLSWETATEQNAARFVIERSADGHARWLDLGSVAATGNAQVTQQYNFMDDKPLMSAYYRLRMIDQDNSFSYSPIIQLQRSNKDATITVFPVPAQDEIQVSFFLTQTGPVTLSLFDLTGKLVSKTSSNFTVGQQKERLDVSTLASGVYLLNVEIDGQRYVERVIKQ